MSLIIALHAAISRHSTRCSGCQVYVQHYAFIDIFGDSQLVIRQMAGECEIRSKTMQTLHHLATELVKELSRSWTKCAACTATVRFHHISRDSNTEADALACLAITNPTSPLVPWESELSFPFLLLLQPPRPSRSARPGEESAASQINAKFVPCLLMCPSGWQLSDRLAAL